MKILKNIGFILCAVVLAYVAGSIFGNIYYSFISDYGSFYISEQTAKLIIGFPLAYLFFLFFLFIAWGDQHKYWWIGIASIPALAFLLYFDLSHIYFHLLFPFAGWLIGLEIRKKLRTV